VLHTIRDFLWIDSQLATAGQPKINHFAQLKEAGFEIVINLLPDASDAYLPEEAALVTSLGMDYHRLSVNWLDPTRENFTDFCALMDAHRERKCFVHCAANKRVSVFLYLWRTVHSGEDPQEALDDLHDVWHPDGVWAEFIALVRREHSGSVGTIL
jgi:protein tyrosine phosphatase (PTP) superfamily phosphohydrolase (DUF442 family)